MPPLAFVDEDGDAPTTAATTRPGPLRRAHSTGTAPISTIMEPLQQGQGQGRQPPPPQQQQPARRPPRPQSVGALAAPGSTSGRLSLHGVTEAVSVGGKEMSRLRLSLVRRRSRRSASHGGEAEAELAAEAEEDEEGDEEMVVLGSTSLLLPSAAVPAEGEGKWQQRRCESVTVSLETVEGGQEGKGEDKGENGEAALNVEVEQAEGFKVGGGLGWGSLCWCIDG